MMPYFLRFLLVIYLCLFSIWLSVPAHAQANLPTGTLVSPNLVYSTVNPWNGPAGTTAPYTWSGFTVTESTGGGVSGGAQPGYNTTTGTFMFGYTQSTIAYAYAFSQALQNSGMSILGYNYSWDYINQDYTRGTLSANVNFAATNGTSLHSKSWTLGPTTNGWTNVAGTETFTSPGLLAANIANFSLSFTGKDDRFWAGYYGPQVKNPSMSLNYTFDACSVNPLSSPTCPGYAVAYKTQQCSSNPLSYPDCPGYQQAYKTQQCSINPLYAVDCPGYAEAYFNYQCQQNGLYSTNCPNYAEAYAKQNILGIGSSTTTTTTTSVSTAAATTQVKNDGTVATEVSKTGDSTVDSAIAQPATTSTTSVTSVTSTVSPVNQNAVPTAQGSGGASQSQGQQAQGPQGQGPQGQGQQNQETKKTDSEIKSAGGGSSDKNDMKGRVEAKAKEVAKAGSQAKTFEAQTATQGLVVGLMGYVPGFDAYGAAKIIDVNGLQMARQYNKATVDNRSLLRQLSGASDRLHNEMVEQQYQIGK